MLWLCCGVYAGMPVVGCILTLSGTVLAGEQRDVGREGQGAGGRGQGVRGRVEHGGGERGANEGVHEEGGRR
jgi:hypothetical protein